MKKIHAFIAVAAIALFVLSIAAFAKESDEGVTVSAQASASVEASAGSLHESLDDNATVAASDDSTNATSTANDDASVEVEKSKAKIEDERETKETDTENDTEIKTENETSEHGLSGNEKIERDTEDNETEDFRSNVTGLENAMLHVRNNETKEHLESVLEKIQEKRKEQLSKLANLTVEIDQKTNSTIVLGEGHAKLFGFIPVSKEYEYEVSSNGSLSKHGRFFDFLFKQEDDVSTSS